MNIIKSNLDFLERENEKTQVNLSAFVKKDKRQKVIKDLSKSVNKALEFEKEKPQVVQVGNIQKTSKPLNEIKKSKPTVWL